MNKLFSLFGKEIRNNIIIIFTFADNFKNIEGVNTLKNKDGIFYKILGNIDQLPFFALNSIAYFSGEKDLFEKIYENNTKNFGSLLKYIFSLNRISLESTKKVINSRILIKNNITNLCDKLRDIMNELNAAMDNQMRLYNLQR